MATTSRLIVKNLPPYVDDARLRDVFSEMGEVTDAKVMRRYGRSRRFGFVGYRTVAQATKAVQHFHRSFLDTARIHVEFAQSLGSESIPRPWSRYAEGSSAHDQWQQEQHERKQQQQQQQQQQQGVSEGAGPVSVTEKKLEMVKDDPEFAEFLAAVGTQGKLWEDADSNTLAQLERLQSRLERKKKKKKKDKEAKKTTGEGEQPTIDQPSSSDDEDGVDEEDGEEGQEEEGEAVTSGMSDMDFLRMKSAEVDASSDDSDDDDDDDDGGGEKGRRRYDAESGSEDEDEDDEEEGTQQKKKKKKTRGGESEEAKKPTPASSSSGGGAQQTGEDPHRLFLRNLQYSVREEDVRDAFEKFGELVEVHVPLTREKRAKGFAFVQFLSPSDATTALEAMDGTVFQGRLMHVIRARAKPADALDLNKMSDEELARMPHKKKKEILRKLERERKDNWNSLFVRSDTVANAISTQYGVDKGDMLSAEGSNAAVRLALAETQVIAETKAFLSENGVAAGAFEGKKSKSKRSATVLLVKNISFDTQEHELRKLFTAYGTLGRVLLPPSRAIAIVEFVEASEARAAFRALAYKKFKHVPIYLEWAPLNMFEQKGSAADSTVPPTGTGTQVRPAAIDMEVEAAQEEEEKLDSAGTASIFVKNVSFDTEDASLERLFADVGPVRSAHIPRKSNPRYKISGRDINKEFLSMGYGFVEYHKAADAKRALRVLQGVELDGHKLILKASDKGSSSSSSANKGGIKRGRDTDVTKIIVKNLPFEATAKELRDLFGTFGQIKRCRIPKKYDGSHRGFGFVDFVTRQEAESAMEALASTHLYGRHLVLEWAQEDESVAAIRERTVKKFKNTHTKL